MINFSLGVFWVGLTMLHHEANAARAVCLQRGTDLPVPEPDRGRIRNNLQGVFRECAQLKLESCNRTILEFEQMEWHQYSFGELSNVLQRLIKDIEHDAKLEYFFHYSKEGAKSIHSLSKKWGHLYQAFKAAKSEIDAGVDCLALGHYTASVFYMCRVGGPPVSAGACRRHGGRA